MTKATQVFVLFVLFLLVLKFVDELWVKEKGSELVLRFSPAPNSGMLY